MSPRAKLKLELEHVWNTASDWKAITNLQCKLTRLDLVVMDRWEYRKALRAARA